MSELYENVARLCAGRGIRVSALCRSAGVSPGILSDLKSGRKKTVSVETAARLGAALGVSVDSIAGLCAVQIDEFMLFYANARAYLTEADQRELMELLRVRAEAHGLPVTESAAAKTRE